MNKIIDESVNGVEKVVKIKIRNFEVSLQLLKLMFLKDTFKGISIKVSQTPKKWQYSTNVSKKRSLKFRSGL